MPFLLAEILNFQGSTHLIGVGSLSHIFILFQKMGDLHKLENMSEKAATDYAAFILRELNSLADVVNNTCYPYVFFDKYNKMLNLADKLILIHGVKFIGQSPKELKVELLGQKQPAIRKMVDRYKMHLLSHGSSYEAFYNCLSTFFNEMDQDNKDYISDREIFKEFIKNENFTADNVRQGFRQNILSTDDLDLYFIEAGRIIVEKDWASIGALQRYLKIGFNRAAHIMDQLEEYGVVGPEEGTKPRKILMNVEQFEKFVEELGNDIHNSTKSTDFIKEKREAEIPVSEILKNKLDIDVDYSKDGEQIRKLKNILIPSSTNDEQCEFINMLLKYNSPETIQLILIDDSIINYSIYNGVPHMLIDAVTEEKKINSAIEWVSYEMQDRINAFLELNVKSIDSFNDKKKIENESTFPRIICVINEANNLPYGVDNILTVSPQT
jgi:hypothetical protein